MEIGDLCTACGQGYYMLEQEPCFCATCGQPPCSACENSWLECSTCGHDPEEDPDPDEPTGIDYSQITKDICS